MRSVRRTGGLVAAVLAAATVATVAAPAPEPAAAQAAPAISVEPSTGLLDGDRVTVSVTGLQPGTWVDAAQCVSVPVDIFDDCDLTEYASGAAAADGAATIDMRVDAVITTGYDDTGGQEIDCRETACVVGVRADDGTMLMAPLTFVPDGALAPPPTLAATPDTDLADLATVTVEGSGFVWAGHALVVQCAADPVSRADCDDSTTTYVELDDTGAFSADVRALAIIGTESAGTVDCRAPGSCVLVATSDWLRMPGKRAVATLEFDPDAEVVTPTLAVSPDADLVDGQRLTVTGSDYPASTGDDDGWVEIQQCTSEPSYETCRWAGFAPVDAAGTFTTEVDVWAVLATTDGDVDCRTADEPCQLVAGRGHPASPRSGRVDLAFAPDGPLLPPPTIEVVPATDLPDVADISVTGSGFAPDDAAWVTVCESGDPSRCDWEMDGFAFTSSSGTFTVDVTVTSSFEVWDGDVVDCLDTACVVMAEDGSGRAPATAEISFAPPADDGVRYLDPVFDDVETTADIAYRTTTDAGGNQVQLTLDLYEPAGDTADERPVIVWTGGGWFGVDDGALAASFAQEFARRGYAVAVIEHRTRPELGCCPTRDAVGIAGAVADATEDVAAGVAWLRDNAADHRLDPDAIVAGGTEGGGAVSFGLAYPGQGRGQPGQVHDGHGENTMDATMDGGPTSDPMVAAALPVSGVSLGEPQEGAPPVLAFHGGYDLTAPAHLSDWTCTAAVKLDARCEVVTYSGAGAGIGASRQRDIVRRATAFVADEVLAPLGYLDPADTPVPTTVPKPTTPDPSSGGATTTTVDEQASGVGDLARTGVNSTGALVRAGLVALALGAGLLLLTRRRRRTDGTGAQGS